MEISYSVEYKKNPRITYVPGMAGYDFYSNRRGTRGIGGVFFKMGGYRLDIGGVSQLLET
jgi:hypothetical protein